MNEQHLVKMANQIGQYFETDPDRKQAIIDTGMHLKRFWDPRMREAIIRYTENSAQGMNDIVIEAVKTQLI